jgi:low affinity Fe/Cu permease
MTMHRSTFEQMDIGATIITVLLIILIQNTQKVLNVGKIHVKGR